RRGGGGGVDARVDREGDTREAVSSAGGADRLDGDRGGREISDRRWVGFEWGQVAGAGGSQARQAGRRAAAPDAGSLSLDRSQAAGDLAHDPPAVGGSEGRGAEADRGDRQAV